jgi:hypothetical protein
MGLVEDDNLVYKYGVEKLESKVGGTWQEMLSVELMGHEGKIELYISFNTFTHEVIVQGVEGVKNIIAQKELK